MVLHAVDSNQCPDTPLRYLSLFSGIGAGELAIHKVFPNAVCVGYSEIDPFALKVYKQHFPDHPDLGDVSKLNVSHLEGQIDLVIGGSPCQGFSSVGSRMQLDDVRSKLLFEYFRIIDQVKPRFFILENVGSMSKAIKSFITERLGVEPVTLNSACFTAQIRNRVYWCNFKVTPKTEHTSQVVQSVLVSNSDRPTLSVLKNTVLNDLVMERTEPFAVTYYRPADAPDTTFKCAKVKPRSDNKANPVCAVINELQTIFDGTRFRKLECIEAERLQGLPDNYTSCLSRIRAYRCIGNSFTVPVIEYIVQHLKLVM